MGEFCNLALQQSRISISSIISNIFFSSSALTLSKANLLFVVLETHSWCSCAVWLSMLRFLLIGLFLLRWASVLIVLQIWFDGIHVNQILVPKKHLDNNLSDYWFWRLMYLKSYLIAQYFSFILPIETNLIHVLTLMIVLSYILFKWRFVLGNRMCRLWFENIDWFQNHFWWSCYFDFVYSSVNFFFVLFEICCRRNS